MNDENFSQVSQASFVIDFLILPVQVTPLPPRLKLWESFFKETADSNTSKGPTLLHLQRFCLLLSKQQRPLILTSLVACTANLCYSQQKVPETCPPCQSQRFDPLAQVHQCHGAGGRNHTAKQGTKKLTLLEALDSFLGTRPRTGRL